MFKNYIKVAIRSLLRNRMLSFVNISGLSIALACVMLILLFVNDEFSFDKFHRKGDRIYRLVQTSVDSSGNERRNGNSGYPHGPAFAAEIPEIENFCRLKGWPMLTKKGTEGLESQVLFVDTTFFKLFSFKILKGNPANMLKEISSVVLTDETAKKYFGNENPIGKTVEIEVDEDFEPFIVSGIIKEAPINSSIRFDMLIPFDNQSPKDPVEFAKAQNDWSTIHLNTFFLLTKGADAAAVQKKLWKVFQKYNGEKWAASQKQFGKSQLTHSLQPFYSMHLDDRFFASNGLQNWSDSKYSYILTGLAILLLFIACINFVNISLAKSMKRSKEIGIRKVSGSSKQQLVFQFLTESFMVSLIAFIPALFLVKLFLPAFNEISQKHFEISYLFQPGIILIFTGLLLLVTFLAGFYPAFMASGFQPVQTLYGRFRLSGKNILGRALVVMQFVIAAGLIICVLVFNKQFNYMTKSDLGYNYENVIRIQFPWGKPAELQRLKNELLREPSIASFAAKAGDWNKTIFSINQKRTDWTYFEVIDDNYLQLLQIPLLKGRYLSYNNPADTISGCMVNEAFVETFLDKSRDPIGQVIERNGQKNKPNYVVGVVKNYHSVDFKEKIEPIYFSLDKHGSLLNTYIKYEPDRTTAALGEINKTFKSILPYSTLDYSFMDEWIKLRYAEDETWKKIVSYSAFIAILISCLGLFALATLSVEQRIKEIGIRKVLGASAAGITALISKDFLKLVLIALVIASPIAWWVMNKWLMDFVYRVSIGWWIFVSAALLAIIVALLTVSYQAIKAAVANPVKSLRTE